jgi:hypothetical protein
LETGSVAVAVSALVRGSARCRIAAAQAEQ